MIRAKMCELLATRAGENSDNFFLVGMLSNLDGLIDAPMEDILETLPLAEDLKHAILIKEGIKGEALQCTISYERWQIADIRFQNLNRGEIREAYLESIEWATNVNQYLG
ncbi:MAG: hypothetical protein ABFS02_05105 [Pseudomonadota bacterium]